MSELERVEQEYRALVTRVIYDSFDGKADPRDERRLSELAEARVRLNAPTYEAAGAG